MMSFYCIFSYILHERLFKFNFNKLIVFRSFCPLIMCVIVGDKKAQAFWMECCSRRLTEMTKNLPAYEQKRV